MILGIDICLELLLDPLDDTLGISKDTVERGHLLVTIVGLYRILVHLIAKFLLSLHNLGDVLHV